MTPARSGSSSRAGSHAGRGFRYQDAVGAWLAARLWSGDLPFGGVVPEGRDDLELVGAAAPTFVQVKSRRDGLGPFPPAAVAGYVRELWDRYGKAVAKPEALLLALERPVTGLPAVDERGGPAELPVVASDAVGALLARDGRADALLPRTRLIVVQAPMERAIAELTGRLGCPPLEAQIHYGELLRRVGELADENGTRGADDFATFSRSDVQAAIDALREATSPGAMEEALRAGLCEAVDFLARLDDPTFYLGVDVQPGHWAAGLAFERPDARARVLEALDARRIGLLVGPSGSGKSALMWEAARASRHTVRWFRVRRLRPEDVPVVLRLARALRASVHAPVGFVLDDVGRSLSTGWDALAREASQAPGIVVLGSIREEDVFLLAERARCAELREVAGNDLAERVWSGLRARGQTAWEGWREPWARSGGLLLEYAHLLTEGDRLAGILREQVDRRIREGRDLELEVVRVVSAAGACGASVDVGRLERALRSSAGDLVRALERLLDEHLVREAGAGRVGGLHQLRSAELFRLSHDVAPPVPERTVAVALDCVPASDLEGLVARTVEADPGLQRAVAEALAVRLIAEPDAAAAASALRGLGQAHVVRTVGAWLPELDGLGIPATQATLAAMFAVADTTLPDIDRLRPLAEAAERLRQMVAEDPRVAFVGSLPGVTLDRLFGHAPGAAVLEELLAALVGARLPDEVRNRLATVRLGLDATRVEVVARLLATLGLLDPPTAESWVAEIGQDKLLQRVEAEVPWTSRIELRDEPEGLAVCGDIRHAAASAQPDLHGQVVGLCRLMLAVVPAARLAVSQGVAPDGEPAGPAGCPPMASKRIPRANLPPDALPAWNRRWVAATASALGVPSETEYLARARGALETLLPALETWFDRWLRGKADDRTLERLAEIHEASRRLTPPRSALPPARPGDEPEPRVHGTPLQSLLFDASADLPRRFARLPEDHAAFVAWAGDLLGRVDEAAGEPWSLVGGAPDDLLGRLGRLVDGARMLAGEAGSRGTAPHREWERTARSARPGNALRLVGGEVGALVGRRAEAVRARVARAAGELGLRADVRVGPDGHECLVWPPSEVLVVVTLDRLGSWRDVLPAAAAPLRDAAGERRRLRLVPLLQGRAVSRLSCGGVATLFPTPYAADEWLEAAGYRLLHDERARAFGDAVDALAEISGMGRFGYGAEGRPAPERAALAGAEDRLGRALATLRRRLAGEDRDLLARVEALVAAARSRVVDLASDLAAGLRGRTAPVVDQVEALSLMMLEHDLRAEA